MKCSARIRTPGFASHERDLGVSIRFEMAQGECRQAAYHLGNSGELVTFLTPVVSCCDTDDHGRKEGGGRVKAVWERNEEEKGKGMAEKPAGLGLMFLLGLERKEKNKGKTKEP